MNTTSSLSKWVRWQPPMVHVLAALVPVVAAAVYTFGWRALVLLAVVNAAAWAAEYAFVRLWQQPVTSAVFVTATLFGLSLPPTLPLWMALVGVVFAVVFGKMVFGGFGKNVFNPALTGRAFIYVSFGDAMTARWGEPVAGPLGGLAAYMPDAVTGATPGMLLKTGAPFALRDLFMGHTTGTLGGECAWLVLLCGLYICWRKAANFRIVIAGLLGFFVVQGGLYQAGVPQAAAPLHAMLAGSFLLGIFFYATDPVSASQLNEGRWVYGAFIGALASLIGVYSAWPAGTMFAILLANMFAPIMDHGIREWRVRHPAPAAGAVPAEGAAPAGGPDERR